MMRELLSALKAISALLSAMLPGVLSSLNPCGEKGKKAPHFARSPNIYYLWHEPLNNLTRCEVDKKKRGAGWRQHLAHVSVNRKLN